MITKQNSLSNLNKTWPFVSLTIIGTLFNFLALFVDDSAALVAIGCSLIAIGVIYTRKASKNQNEE